MLIVATLLSIADHLYLYLACLVLAGALGTGLNYIFLRRYVSGLLLLQLSFVFNSAIIFFGCFRGTISVFRVGHFFFYELTVVVGIYWVYRKILRHRERLFEQLSHWNAPAVSALLVSFNGVLFGLYMVVVIGNEGGSRIEFMTASWFSFFRPVMSILAPLSFFFPLYLLDCGKRFLPSTIMASSILSSVASGSKGNLLFGSVSALLLYQELKGARLVIPRALKFSLVLLIALAGMVTLGRLEVDGAELAQRFVRFGESTILVYYADDPTTAAAGVSMLAKIHRGVARVLGDSSAADVDTLFGFALSHEDNNGSSFTGPNAAIPSYMLCNYSGWQNIVGFASILGYLAIVAWFVKRLVGRQVLILLLPFAVTSLNAFVQDYYQGMSDVTLILMAALAMTGFGITALACRGERITRGAA